MRLCAQAHTHTLSVEILGFLQSMDHIAKSASETPLGFTEFDGVQETGS